ncbi:MAG: cysteine peptidase family C39 domain-containing protein [Planctomycetota bacterium]
MPKIRGSEGCGAQALATAVAWVRPDLDATALAEEMPWHDEGATPVDLLLDARARGCVATIARGTWEQLDESVADGRATLVMFDAAPALELPAGSPFPRLMHWGVVSGVARDGSAVLVGAPGGRHRVIRREDFLRRWARSDYCLIVLDAP